jgi:hypothetical protein
LAGKTFHAELDESGFSVNGDSSTWRVPWDEVTYKAESKTVFLFLAKNTLFIFGKRYLDNDKQKSVRQLATMP